MIYYVIGLGLVYLILKRFIASLKFRLKNNEIQLKKKLAEIKALKNIINFVCDYDPQCCQTLERFTNISQQTHCLFAKRAKLWASRPWDNKLSFEENIYRSIPTFIKWVG